MNNECSTCAGIATTNGLDDCSACEGTGYADKVHRSRCDRCGSLKPLEDMHVSPDEDGNRAVCGACCFELERQCGAAA